MTTMLRVVAVILIVMLGCGTAFASAVEGPSSNNFWTQFDITFWQTFPFAAFWGHAVSAQLLRGAVNWAPVLNFALAASAANAYLHARKVTE